MTSLERDVAEALVDWLVDLRFDYRAGARDHAGLEDSFGDDFESVNRVKLTDGEFYTLPCDIRVLDEMVEPYEHRAHDLHFGSGGKLMENDKRWAFGTPPVGNTKYAWIQHFIHYLGQLNGRGTRVAAARRCA